MKRIEIANRPGKGRVERLFTPNFLLIWGAAFFSFASFHLLLPVLPLYVIDVGGTQSQVGIVLGILTVTSVTVRTWVGQKSDRLGKKMVMVWGTLGLVLSAVSYPLAASVLLLVVLRLVHGITWAATTTPSAALVADVAPPERRAEAMGWYGTGSSLAMAVAPLLAVTIQAVYGFDFTFIVGAALAFIALGATVFVTEPRRGAPPATPAPGSGPFWRSLVYRPAILPAASIFVVSLTYGSMISFLPLLAYSKNANPGIFFSVYAVFLIIARPLGGRLADLRGRSAAIVPGILAMAAGLVQLAFAADQFHFLVSAMLYGTGFSLVNPALLAMTADRAAPEAQGAAMGTFSAAFDLGIGVGAILFGLVLEKAGFQTLFLGSAGVAILGLVTYLVGSRRRQVALP